MISINFAVKHGGEGVLLRRILETIIFIKSETMTEKENHMRILLVVIYILPWVNLVCTEKCHTDTDGTVECVSSFNDCHEE